MVGIDHLVDAAFGVKTVPEHWCPDGGWVGEEPLAFAVREEAEVAVGPDISVQNQLLVFFVAVDGVHVASARRFKPLGILRCCPAAGHHAEQLIVEVLVVVNVLAALLHLLQASLETIDREDVVIGHP